MSLPEAVRDRALAAYLGCAVGDALGATTEFMTANEIKAQYKIHRNIVGGGWLHLKPGRITDDTEMNLALGRALIEAKGFDLKAIAEHFVGWIRSKPVDIGHTVRLGIQHYRNTGEFVAPYSEQSAGNGGVMRTLPTILATLSQDREVTLDWSLQQSRITHNHPEADVGVCFMADLIRATILLGQTAPLKTINHQWQEEHPKFAYQQFKRASEGYVVGTLKTVLYYFFHTWDFESCLVGIVNAGGDADTHAAIAGMLAGAFYGLESFPHRWLKKLDPNVKKEITQQVEALCDF